MSDVDHLVIRPGEWRLRWLYTIQGNRLHKIEQVRAISEERTHVDGVSACGHEAVWCMPGFFSRMSMPRCKRCCKWAGVPEGNGNPYNEGIKE